MPLEPSAWSIDPQLTSLISGLLQRSASERLGTIGGASAIKRHPLFQGIEWDLLKEERLPAPFLPNPNLVYAKDFVLPLSDYDPATPGVAEPIAKPQDAAGPPADAVCAPSAVPSAAEAAGGASVGEPSERGAAGASAMMQLQPRRAASMVMEAELLPPAEVALAEAQSEEFLAQWDYVSGEAAYAKELRELVRKSPDGNELWAARR